MVRACVVGVDDGFIETELIEISNVREARERHDDDLMTAVDQVRAQSARPRKNLGSSGPPGRAD